MYELFLKRTLILCYENSEFVLEIELDQDGLELIDLLMDGAWQTTPKI